MSTNWAQDIYKMHGHFGISTAGFDKAKLLEFIKFRLAFLDEELTETKTAKNPEDFVDGLIDLCVVAIGTLDLLDVDSNVAWDRVLRANMAKKAGYNESRPNKFGFPDLVKPEGWTAPDHADIVPLRLHYDYEPAQLELKFTEVEEGLCVVSEIKEPESVTALRECIALQLRKAADYQNPNSGVTQAMYYRRGIETLNDEIWKKWLRIQSLLESGAEAKNESIEDSYKDMINYCSFSVAWLRGGIPGQNAGVAVRMTPFTSDQRDHGARFLAERSNTPCCGENRS